MAGIVVPPEELRFLNDLSAVKAMGDTVGACVGGLHN